LAKAFSLLPGEFDNLERMVVHWLKSQKGFAKQAGEAWGAFDELTGTDVDNRTSLPVTGDAIAYMNQLFGEPYDPQTEYGKAGYGATMGVLGGLTVAPSALRFGQWALRNSKRAAGLGASGGLFEADRGYNYMFPPEQSGYR
jgi:hypothetical protein